MKYLLEATIFSESENRYTAWLNDHRGIVTQGDSVDDVKNSLMEMAKVKFTLDHKEINFDETSIIFYLWEDGKEYKLNSRRLRENKNE